MQQVLKEFTAAVHACLKLASDTYKVDLSPANVVVDNTVKGKVAGWACPKRHGKYRLRFNLEAILNHNEQMTKDTIPHEVAHLVCFARPELGDGHNWGWKAVCRHLGGDDSRTHDMLLTPAKIVESRRVEYRMPSGRICMVGPKHHKLIQSGNTGIFMRNPKEFLRAEYWVGYGKVAAPTQAAAQQPRPIPGLNIVRSDIPTLPQGGTKREKAEAIYKANKHLARGEVIKLFVAYADMTPAGAATYYQNFKSGKY